VVKTVSAGSVKENAEILLNILTECTHKEIWLMSMSKGSAEVRLMYQLFSDKVPAEKISYWFNVGGLARGSQFVDDMMRSSLRRAKTRAIWGADHYMRDARVIPILYHMFSYFLDQKTQ
jgi:hypothetical protein